MQSENQFCISVLRHEIANINIEFLFKASVRLCVIVLISLSGSVLLDGGIARFAAEDRSCRTGG